MRAAGGQLHPPPEIKAVRDLIRYRAKIARQRVSEIARLGDVLQDAGIRLDSVASSIATKSGRAMIEALIDGEWRGQVLADLAIGRMRSKIPDLSMALEGRFGEHHAMLCRLHLDHTDHLQAMIAQLEARIEAMIQPYHGARDLLVTIPGIGAAVGGRRHFRDRPGPPATTPGRRAAGVVVTLLVKRVGRPPRCFGGCRCGCKGGGAPVSEVCPPRHASSREPAVG
jgi:transposase